MINSFVRRGGKMTPSQKQAWKTLSDAYLYAYDEKLISETSLFSQSGKRVIEIGFGMGHNLVQMAVSHPDTQFLGIEVHRPGVGAVMAQCEALSLTNVKLICHDAVEILSHQIEDNSIDRILIYFPDPWPKKRHQKRRLIQNDFMQLISSKLISGGVIHLATDWADYAIQMKDVISQQSYLQLLNNDDQDCLSLPRSTTKFQRRGERLGYVIEDIFARKI